MLRLFCVLTFVLLVPNPALAIVIRHDRSDSQYTALAKGFKAYGDVVEAGSTLVAPNWLLTAGHVAREISPYTSFARVNGRRYPIDRVIFHPDYVKAGMRGPRDLALLRLAEPVKGAEPVRLYRGQDEAGQVVTFIGRGQTGSGETGPTGQDGKMRGATNKLEKTEPNSVYFEFDAPETATELEGISGPGDSGGPALVKVDGKWSIVGVSSANIGRGKGLCRYGTVEVYARVSTAIDWIEETMRSTPESTVAWEITSPFQAWPETRPGEIAAALVSAFSSGDAATMEAFHQKYKDPQALKRGTPERRAETYHKHFKEIGSLTVLEVATDPSGRMLALLKNSRARHYQLSLYFLDKAFNRFDGYWIGEASPRLKARGTGSSPAPSPISDPLLSGCRLPLSMLADL